MASLAVSPYPVVPFVRRPALERFAEKCRFDATTGCVLWIGGKSSGQGNSATYGVFKDRGRRWFVHRWAAVHIHGFEIEGLQVDHCCNDAHGRPAPNTLCVQHLQPVTLLENLQLRWGRRIWGWDEWREPDPIEPDPDALPFHTPPDWLRPFLSAQPEEPF